MLLAALILSTGAVALAAQASDTWEGRQVSLISFDPADQPLPRPELDRLVAFHPGDRLQPASIRDAIQNLYSTGRYTDIAVDVRQSGEGMEIRFITTQSYFVGRVTSQGSPDPPNAGQLVTATKLQLGTSFADNDLLQATENILNRLRANGLYNAQVTHEISRDDDIEQINIDFTSIRGAVPSSTASTSKETPADPGRCDRSTNWRRPFGLFGWNPLTEKRLQSGIDNVRSYYQSHDRLLARVVLSKLDYNEETNTVTPKLDHHPGPPGESES